MADGVRMNGGGELAVTKTFSDLRGCGKRVIVLEGGSRSGKTWAIIQYIVVLCLSAENPLRIIVARSRLTWLKLSVFVDFKEVLKGMGLWDDGALNKSDMTYVLNGSVIVFTGLDSDEGQKIHGIPSDYVWLNEADDIPWRHVNQFLLRMRKQMFVDFNPKVGAMHWLYERVGSMVKVGKAGWFKSTFKDNPFLNADIVGQIMGYEPTEENRRAGTADPVMWNIYGLGQRDQVKGLVFPDWEVVEAFPRDVQNVCYGMDFGYSIDPTTLVMKGEVGPDLYLREMLWMKGLTAIETPGSGRPSVEGEFKRLRIERNVPIYADCAEPRTIDDVRSRGWWVEKADKRAGITSGIEVMKRYKIHVTEDSLNLIKELGMYKWALDRDGNPMNVPHAGHDHMIDAARYACSMSCGRMSGGTTRCASARTSLDRQAWSEDGEGEQVRAFDLMAF